MVVKPKIKGFICTTAHPKGCKENVRAQIEYVKAHRGGVQAGPKNVLVIGASGGFGLSSRIVAAYLYAAATIGVYYDKEPRENRTATAGYYNTAAFEQFAKEDGLYASSVNGDGFSKAVKQETIQRIQKDFGKVDLVIYSLAAPRRTLEDGSIYNSVLKTIGQEYSNKSIDVQNEKIINASIPPASEEEIAATIKVMGGEDWYEWMSSLRQAGVLAKNAVTVAYSYIGPSLTFPMYYHGTIGKAKEHLNQTAKQMNEDFKDLGLKAYISVNKALVTQSSSAIPIVPLYISILYKIMKEKGTHEGCIEQIYRLFTEKKLLTEPLTDEEGRIRIDDLEMQEEVQAAVTAAWEKISDADLSCADIAGYKKDFHQIFGFEVEGVDYEEDVEIL